MKNFKAFSLAEVLITLGVIGTVAAMTLPSVINNYQKKQTAIKLKHCFSNFQNAIRLSIVDNGELNNWNFPVSTSVSSVNNTNNEIFVKTYFLPYFKSAAFYTAPELETKYSYLRYTTLDKQGRRSFQYSNIVLNDGTLLSFVVQSSSYIWVISDINGIKGPNRMGRDIFVLGGMLDVIKNKNLIGFWHYDGNSASGYGCNKLNHDYYAGYSCGSIIQNNNWEIPDDYPW